MTTLNRISGKIIVATITLIVLLTFASNALAAQTSSAGKEMAAKSSSSWTTVSGKVGDKMTDGFLLALLNNGEVVKVKVGNNTVFYVNGHVGSYADLKSGQYVYVSGNSASSMTFNAYHVYIKTTETHPTATPTITHPTATATTTTTQATYIYGTVGNKLTDGFMLALSNGQTVRVVVSSSTVYYIGGTTGNFNDIHAGMFVYVKGYSNGGMTFKAVMVYSRK